MAFCANCGAQATGSFCPNCGSPITAGGGRPMGTGPMGTGSMGGAGFTTTPPIASAPGLSTNVASALCYLLGFITGIIFLVWAPYNRNRTIRFHAWQSIFLNVAFIAVSIILPAIGHFVGVVLLSVIDLAGFVLWIYLLFSAFNGKNVRLPWIADLADKQANS
jgi:uncharacterized membrane protein